MEKFMILLKHRTTLFIFRWILGLFFIYASLNKIVDPAGFAQDIQNYEIVPYALTNMMGIIMPWLEFLTGLFLIIGTMVRGSAFIISGMLVVFTIALSAALVRGLDIHCGCFPANESQEVNLRLELIIGILRDIILLVMSFAVYQFTGEGNQNK